jgi:hypothetical protein
MDTISFDAILILIKKGLSLTGGIVILIGALYAIGKFFVHVFKTSTKDGFYNLDVIRLDL